MNSARLLLGFAAAILFATAAFHASGAAEVSGWLPGQRGAVLDVLWIAPVIDWATVGVVWLFTAWQNDRRLAPLVWISAVIPLLMAVLLVKAVGPGHPGIWLLVGASAFASLGAARLPARDSGVDPSGSGT